MKKLLQYYIMIIAVISMVSCEQNSEQEVSLFDFGVATYKEPFVAFLSSHPGFLVKSLEYPPFSWMKSDTVIFSKDFEVEFNDDCVRSKSKAYIQLTDTLYRQINDIVISVNDQVVDKSAFQIVADSSLVPVHISITVSPSVGDTTFIGYLLVRGDKIDVANDVDLQNANNVVATWKFQHKIGWPIAIWSIWLGILALIVFIIVFMFKSLFNIIGSLIMACKSFGLKDYRRWKKKNNKSEKRRERRKKIKNMNARFFKPYVGSKYNMGINSKRVLVLGASFYCGRKDCKFFAECTNPTKKDSSKFDTCCPEYASSNQRLSEEPSNAIAGGYKTYRTFGAFMQQFLKDQTEDVWKRMAFMNYLQFFSPTIDTKKEYLSRRDFEAFNETLAELKPNIVVAWGTTIIEEIREKNPYVIDLDKLTQTEQYIFHIRIPQVSHDIAVVNCYHPASMSHWYNNLDTLTKYMKQVIK